MAIGATIYTFDVQLSDVDRGIYDEVALRAARHPSETDAYLVTRVLAYLLEYEAGIVFAAGGVSSPDEPAVLVRDLTGHITKWIEVGAPDAERLHFASKLADTTAVYTHRDTDKLLAAWSGKTIHRAEAIAVRSFDPSFIAGLVERLGRRNTVSLSVTEGQLYLELNGEQFTGEVREHRVA